MNSMLIALQITALSMGLVFAAILLLWGMMALLTVITADKKPSASESLSGTLPVLDMDDSLKARAATAAVAMALAESQVTMAHDLCEPPTTIVSAWQLGMRTRQMYQKGGSFRRRAN